MVSYKTQVQQVVIRSEKEVEIEPYVAEIHQMPLFATMCEV